MTEARSKFRLLRHISAREWRQDRQRLRIIEAALDELDPTLPAHIQDQRMQPHLRRLDELAESTPVARGES